MRRREIAGLAVVMLVSAAALVAGAGSAAVAGGCYPQPRVGAESSLAVRADFNGDGWDDIALFYDYGGGHVALWTMSGQGCSDSAPPARRWDAPHWGSGTKFMLPGDFNGDGKTDIALFYDYGGGHVALWTLTADANGDGGFSEPVLRRNLPYWGGGTNFVTSDDFNRDRKSDIALVYDYGGGHVSLWTLTADANGDGALSGPVLRRDLPYWGGGTKFAHAGDFANSGPGIALFYDYGGGHVSVFLMIANANGGFGGPSRAWDAPHWGSGTRFMTVGDFNQNGGDDIALDYAYSARHNTLFTLLDGPTVAGFGSPVTIYDDPGMAGEADTAMIPGQIYTEGSVGIKLFQDLNTVSESLWHNVQLCTATNYGEPTPQGYSCAYGWSSSTWGAGTKFVL